MIKQIIVKNCENKECNGIYKLLKQNFYEKDSDHHLYKWNNTWRLANYGKQVYFELNECKNNEWDIEELDMINSKLIINEINIITFLSKYIGEEIIYIPNPGNAGDSLIAYGTLQVFNNLKLNYKIGNINQKYNNKILFYAGKEGVLS